ncbi:hypothetical protein CBS101457_004037 [Exobasidium rhododendri]|nr:hypothetical protein CBS101457_004037 [Exobasidium rhododendri]
MAKKKKTALKPAINRGFATTSTPSKRPEPPKLQSSQPTTGTNTPSEEERRSIALAIDSIVLGGNVKGENEEESEDEMPRDDRGFDHEKAEEQALQNLVDRLREKIDKDVNRVWKGIEFDRRQSRQLPIFEMDAQLQDEVITFINSNAEKRPVGQTIEVGEIDLLLSSVSSSSAAADLLQKALVTHALLLRLGFTSKQAVLALSSCHSITDIDECVAWLAGNLTTAELDVAERKAEGKPAVKDKTNRNKEDSESDSAEESDFIDTTKPPLHEGFSFERQISTKAFPKSQSSALSSLSTSVSATPVELSPSLEKHILETIAFTKAQIRNLDDQSLIDVLENPVNSCARAKLYIIQAEKVSSNLEKDAKEITEGSSPLLDEARRKLLRVKSQARSTIDQCQESRDWNRGHSDRIFLQLKVEWEAEEAEGEKQNKERGMKQAQADAGGAELPTDNGNHASNTEDQLDDRSETSSDEDGIFGDMLDEQAREVTDTNSQTTVKLRDLPPQMIKGGGNKSPKVLLSDALHRVDPYASSRFEVIATGGRMFRSRLILRWSVKAESFIDTYTMTCMATSTQSSAEDILAVASLMCIEERPVYKSLAGGWRDWWTELEGKRQEERDRRSRATFRQLLEALHDRLVEENVKAEEKKQRLKLAAAAVKVSEGRGTNAGEDGPLDAAEAVGHAANQHDITQWERKVASPGYQRMLPGRQNLPIAAFREHILQVLSQSQVFVLSGETGCGKSTQVPAYILEDCLSHGQPCKIYVTEPRRISAISLAERVSLEMGEPKGAVGKSDSLIGSAVRLESNIGRNSKLVFATTGIVLRMLEGSRLEGVTHVILDEVHERSIESDFLLIILKSLLEARPELKVILMSATLDAKRISDYFGGCPTVDVPGRTFPVDVRWLEDAVELCDYTIEDGSFYARRQKYGQETKGNQARLQSHASTSNGGGGDDEENPEDDDSDDDKNVDGEKKKDDSFATRYSAKTISTLDRMDEYKVNHDLIVSLLEQMCFKNQSLIPYSAAILVFLPGIAEIRKLNDLLQVHPGFGSRNFQLFPLHSTISSENQSMVFDFPPHGVRKIVLSTNIAETGITIPDITCVIDTGKHREMRFDEKRQMSKLVECFVAKSNAKQRRGRAGRVQNGLCWHLFTRHRHDQYLAEHPLPEMLRLSLQDLSLKLKVMKVRIGTSIEDSLSKALDPPTSINIQRSVASLIEIRALTSTEEITALGRHLAKIPLDVHMGKFLLIACSLQILDSALTIAATLNAKSPFTNPFGRELEARNAKKSFDFGDSDFLTIVRAFNSWRRATENGVAKQFCQKCFLNQTNLIQIEELRQQYMTYLLDSGFVNVDEETRKDILGARFRFNHAKTKFLTTPPSLNVNSGSLAMINTALASALYPKLLVIDTKNGGLRTLTNGAPAAIHPSSVNFKMKLYHLPKGINHLIYFTIMQSKRLYAWETGAIDDKGILLMCGDADFKFSSRSLYVDRTRLRITFYDLKTLVVLKVLRDRMTRLLNSSYRNPTKAWTGEEEVFFALVCRVLGVGANDRDRAFS